jgi:3-oxoacyl-[acyl-carrier-protein] synthase-1
VNSLSRIVFTGLGAVCGAGLTLETIWDAVQAGRSAIGPLTQWGSANGPVRHAAEVVGVGAHTLVEDRKIHKYLSRTDLFGLYAAQAAIRQSGLLAFRGKLDAQAAARFNDRTGVFVGSGGGIYRSNYEFFPLMTTAAGDLRTFGRELESSVNPMWLLTHLPNNVLCYIGIQHGFKGTNACVTNQCVGGIQAIVEGAAAIGVGEAERAVAAGHDTPIEPETILYYHRLGLLTQDTLRPFDRERSGTVFGEGAAAVVLEPAAAAEARHAPILGEFLGSGCVSEGTGIVDVRPDGDGVKRAIELALAEAGITPDQVSLIVAHGNGTRASDASEAVAILSVFGKRPPPVTAFKWAFGHLIAGSGILDVVMALIALRKGVAPGIPTLRSLDPELAPLPVSAAPQQLSGEIAVVLCRGFGGMNTALVLRAASPVPYQ